MRNGSHLTAGYDPVLTAQIAKTIGPTTLFDSALVPAI